MSEPGVQKLKVALGLLLGLGIGAVCRVLTIPAPAPPVLEGALLVVAMTLGYGLADRAMQERQARREARHRHLCGGPDGQTQAQRAPRSGPGSARESA